MSSSQPTAGPTLSESFRSEARKLLAGAGDGASPSITAALAVQAIERLSQRLAQLVGETGVRALLARSVALASATYPWLGKTITVATPMGSPWDLLRAALEQQDPHAGRDGFVVTLSVFVELLARLIGEGLVRRLLHDVWPEVFPQVVKETT